MYPDFSVWLHLEQLVRWLNLSNSLPMSSTGHLDSSSIYCLSRTKAYKEVVVLLSWATFDPNHILCLVDRFDPGTQYRIPNLWINHKILLHSTNTTKTTAFKHRKSMHITSATMFMSCMVKSDFRALSIQDRVFSKKEQGSVSNSEYVRSCMRISATQHTFFYKFQP